MISLFLLPIFLVFSSTIVAAKHLTVLIYMDSTDNLTDAAMSNIQDMMLVGSTEHVTVLVQWCTFNNLALRCKIEKGTMKQIQSITVDNPKQDLIDAARWAFTSFASKHTMLILWNHGWGILDPVWDSTKKQWVLEPDVSHTIADDPLYCELFNNHIHNNHKGFMFHAQPKTYLKSRELADALNVIQDTVLQGKKLDILGFDTCMGAMIELSYQLAPYVNYHIGSQNCELKDGWDYAQLLTVLAQKTLNPREIVTAAVSMFNEYYKEKSSTYTLSGIDLSYSTALKEALDNFIYHSTKQNAERSKELQAAIALARQSSSRFCLVPMYTDLYAFCSNLHAILSSSIHVTYYQELLKCLDSLCKIIQQAVISRCQGETIRDKAHGLSIYFPCAHIDSSYRNAFFAQESQWLDFLNFSFSINSTSYIDLVSRISTT